MDRAVLSKRGRENFEAEQEDRAILTKRARYKAPMKEGPAIQGVLKITEKRFEWNANNRESLDSVNQPFIVIKAQGKGAKRAMLILRKGDEPEMADTFVFDFDNFSDRDACHALVSKILRNQKSSGGVPAAEQPPKASISKPPTQKPLTPKPLTPKPLTPEPLTPEPLTPKPPTPTFQSERLDLEGIMRRVKVLQADSGLQKLHSQLVLTGVLSEEEFWSVRKHLLDDDAAQGPKQRTGVKSSMLADLRPLTDGRTNNVTFNLTPEIIREIFCEKPAVHRAYLLNVPSKMNEQDFWAKYCRAEYLYRSNNQAAAAAEAADDEELAWFTEEDDIIVSESLQKIKEVDPTVDLAADLADDYTHLPGHGILRDGRKEVENHMVVPKKRSILSDINRHSAAVLKGCPLGGMMDCKETAAVAETLAIAQQAEANKAGIDSKRRRLEMMEQMTLNDDLQGPQNQQYAPLCIQDPRQYFESQKARIEGVRGRNSVDPSKAMGSFKEQFAAFKRNGMTETAVKPRVALKVLQDLNADKSATKYTFGESAGKDNLDVLPKSLKDEVLHQSATGNELQRNFWATYPLTTAASESKAGRLNEAMSKLYSQIQSHKESTSGGLRHLVSQLQHPMLQALDAACTHYEDSASKG